ncbi:hypothetical protein CQ14_41095 [Bradyrhizobium lablabi]|uniref:Uncharacterized protein n=1 Tax=Bradyrhizobium lablabi TaxID=722472 RepID=A0A0R3N7K7_9BRAD|nr:hypothetical protein CQ14_41095 [Bradyrhizobium lablabi]
MRLLIVHSFRRSVLADDDVKAPSYLSLCNVDAKHLERVIGLTRLRMPNLVLETAGNFRLLFCCLPRLSD